MERYKKRFIEHKEMNAYEALFNCHINDALNKAIDLFIKKYGENVYNKQIAPFVKRGVMGIFEKNPNEYTIFFVDSVTNYVNS